MSNQPFYNPNKSYEENWHEGPFGAFANDLVFKDRKDPKYEVFGCKINLPFGIPAGPLLNGKFIKAALDKGFDLPMHKTVRTRVYPSYSWPNILAVQVEGDLTLEKASHPLVATYEYDGPISITNSFGNPSMSPDVWQQDIADCVAYAKPGQLIAASVEGTRWPGCYDFDYIKDWAIGARLLKETGVHIIEANLSCPNEGTANMVCHDSELSRMIAWAMKDEIGDTPLLLKTAYFPKNKYLIEFVSKVGGIVDGIASINTISAEIIDENGNQALPGEKRKRSGVCGASIKWAGVDMVKRLAKVREKLNLKYTIVGVGGVTTPADYFEYKKAGADIVMSATGAMWDPFLAVKIKKQILRQE